MCVSNSPHFATGQLNGYFGGRPPEKFFRLLAFYMASYAVLYLLGPSIRTRTG